MSPLDSAEKGHRYSRSHTWESEYESRRSGVTYVDEEPPRDPRKQPETERCEQQEELDFH
jgi:hypothetical protein